MCWKYVLITLFGTSPMPWFLVFTFIHAINGLLAFRFFKRLLSMLGWLEQSITVPLFLGICIWIWGPLVTEAVIWKGCSHYLITVAMMLYMLNCFLKYVENGNNRELWKMFIAYYLSTFFIEYFYLIPIYIITITLFLFITKLISLRKLKDTIFRAFLPIVLIFCVYYITLYFYTSMLVARIESNNINLNFLSIGEKLNKYIIQIYLIGNLLPNKLRILLYDAAGTPFAIMLLAVICCIVGGLIFVPKISKSVSSRILILLFLLSCCSCLAILPMWFFELFPYEGSRYFYLPSLFFYILLTCIIFSSKKIVKIRLYAITLYLCICLGATFYLVINVRNATIIFYKIATNFKWQKSEKVLLLNLPMYYKGVFILSAEKRSNFATHYSIFGHKKFDGKFYDVLAYNMTGRYDGAHVTVLDSVSIKVSLSQDGGWWWYESLGAADYENDMYSVKLTDGGQSYILTLKQKPSAGTVLLYLVGGDNWKEVDMTKINVEQW